MTLRRYVLKRLLLTIPILIGVSAITFGMMKLLPGNVVDFLIGLSEASPRLKEQLYAQYHLDEPVYMQYLLWLRDAVTLNFGISPVSQRPVTTIIMERLPRTVLLGLASFLIAMLIGLPAGTIAAVRKGDLTDEASRVFALLGIATPNFWLGLILLYVFGVQLGWFSTIPPLQVSVTDPDLWVFMILPAITLGTASSALLMRLARSSVLEQINKDHVRMARAKGLSDRKVIVKHVVRNSLIPVVTAAALQIAFLVDGAVVVEQVFSYPGLGQKLVSAIIQRDIPVVQAAVLLIGVTIVFANLMADILYAYLDPRIRY